MRRTLALLLALGGCRRQEAPPRDVVRVGYQRYISYAPIFIAESEGYFAKHGIQLELVLMPDGNTGTPLVVSGGIDALAGPGSPGDPERDCAWCERPVRRGQGLRAR